MTYRAEDLVFFNYRIEFPFNNTLFHFMIISVGAFGCNAEGAGRGFGTVTINAKREAQCPDAEGVRGGDQKDTEYPQGVGHLQGGPPGLQCCRLGVWTAQGDGQGYVHTSCQTARRKVCRTISVYSFNKSTLVRTQDSVDNVSDQFRINIEPSFMQPLNHVNCLLKSVKGHPPHMLITNIHQKTCKQWEYGFLELF